VSTNAKKRFTQNRPKEAIIVFYIRRNFYTFKMIVKSSSKKTNGKQSCTNRRGGPLIAAEAPFSNGDTPHLRVQHGAPGKSGF
jgi:hypothetical protein